MHFEHTLVCSSASARSHRLLPRRSLGEARFSSPTRTPSGACRRCDSAGHRRLKRTGARVSLFSDPDASDDQIGAARATGADRIELYTGPYGGRHDDPAGAGRELEKLGLTADRADAAGLGVNAGHDLTVANLPPLSRRIPHLAEVSIGHGLTADALEHGMAGTVKRFLKACGW